MTLVRRPDDRRRVCLEPYGRRFLAYTLLVESWKARHCSNRARMKGH